MLFEFKDLPQIPSINFWTSRAARPPNRDRAQRRARISAASTDKNGRFMVIMTPQHGYLPTLGSVKPRSAILPSASRRRATRSGLAYSVRMTH
jgi:hypothetical protein